MNRPGPARKARQWLRRLMRPAVPSFFRRAEPLSAVWGLDRGNPVDRYYIERFLAGFRGDIHGRTLEVGDTQYTDQFGTAVTRGEVLDIDASNPKATLVADLAASQPIASALFDCFILTQTLQFIYDVDAAISNSHHLLKPGGVLLATLPAVSRIDPDAREDCWRFTSASCTRLFAASFGAANVTVESYGSLPTCVAFLQGIAQEELSRKQLTRFDPAFPLLVCVRAVKAV